MPQKSPILNFTLLRWKLRGKAVLSQRSADFAIFWGQIFVETGGFGRMVENLNYKNPERLDAIFSAVRGIDDARSLIALGSEAIANRVYARRLGNGSESSGDGWRYRGSGYKQLTGCSN